MTIHAEAEAARQHVYDTRFAELQGLLETAQQATTAEAQAHDVTKQQLAAQLRLLDEANTVAAGLRAQVAALEAQLTKPNPYDPISFTTLDEAITKLGAPKDANYVTWRWGDDVMLEQAFMDMATNDILVLPERDKPYLIDSADGFRAAGVTSIDYGTRPDGTTISLPIKSRYRDKTARTWFAMARARRGIIGMGPGARIEIAPADFKLGQQPPQGQMIVRPSGQVLSSATMRIIEAEHTDSFFANFTAVGRDLGGVAYSGVVQKNGTAKRIKQINFSRGHLNHPNGETGAVTFNGRYLVEDMEISGRDTTTGARVGTSPVMVNSSAGGIARNVYVHDTYAGPGITIWSSSGKHVFENVRTESASGINLEANKDGFELEWTGGSNLIDYKKGVNGRNDRPEFVDAKPGGNNSLHIGMRSPNGSQKVTLRNVDIDQGPWPGNLSVQLYWATSEARLQRAVDVRAFDKTGQPIPVRFTDGGLAAGV